MAPWFPTPGHSAHIDGMSQRTNRRIWIGVAMLALAIGGGRAYGSFLHEIPSDVTVQAFVKPDGNRLYLLVRVPLEAMRDVEFPLRGPGFLDVTRANRSLETAAGLWIEDYVELHEGGARLREHDLVAVRASIPTDQSFRSFEEAFAHVTGPPLPESTSLFWNQALLDVLIQYPISAEKSEFSIRPNLERLALRVTTVLRFLPPNRPERVFQYTGDAGLVRLDPRWHQAARTFVKLGFVHILDGLDHLLFLLCLVIPFRRLRTLIPIVTGFTVAHSITLIASALNLAPNALWFPPLVETLIAASIVYTALENIVGTKVQRRVVITLAFGLVHGFGFSFALREQLQFGGSHLMTSLLSFNLGVELGQVLVIVLLVPIFDFLFKFAKERMGTIIVSALVAHSSWHWMTERASVLREYQVIWPALNLRILVLVPAVAAVGWLAYGLVRHVVSVKAKQEAPV